MKITICDVCGKRMSVTDTIVKPSFTISSDGKTWDICTECRDDILKYMTVIRRASK